MAIGTLKRPSNLIETKKPALYTTWQQGLKNRFRCTLDSLTGLKKDALYIVWHSGLQKNSELILVDVLKIGTIQRLATGTKPQRFRCTLNK